MISKEKWIENRFLKTEEVVQLIPQDIKQYAYVVGAWVWITFPRKPNNSILEQIKDLGFTWNHKRNAWQHPCGLFSRHAPYDPREKYEITRLEE